MNRLLAIFLLGFSCCWNDIHGILVCLDSAYQTLQNTNGHSSLFFTIHLDFTIWISLKPMNEIDHLVCRSVPWHAEGFHVAGAEFRDGNELTLQPFLLFYAVIVEPAFLIQTVFVKGFTHIHQV